MFRLVHEMRIGDFIVYPRKIDRTLRWGEIASAYRFDPAGASDYPHRRDVRWTSQRSRDAFSQGALYELGSALTLFEIKSFADEFLLKFEDRTRANSDFLALPQDDDTNQSVTRDIVETTKDFISKKLKTDLKGFAMEPFVAELFRAMGYKAQTTRHVKDDGVDVIAHSDVLGIEPPILKIQVKSQDGNVGADAVKSFYANIHDRDVGIFITMGGYTEAAAAFARTRPNLKLIPGVEFVDLIQTYYDSFDLKYRQQIPLRRVLIPDVELGDE